MQLGEIIPKLFYTNCLQAVNGAKRRKSFKLILGAWGMCVIVQTRLHTVGFEQTQTLKQIWF